MRRGLSRVSLGVAAAGLLSGCASLLPWIGPELAMVPPPGSDQADPRRLLVVEVKSVGAWLVQVEVHDETGAELFGKLGETRFTLKLPEVFGREYRVRATAEDAFGSQRISREMRFRSVAMPRLEGPAQRSPDADGAVTLHFDRPIGALRLLGGPAAEVHPDARRTNVRIQFSSPPAAPTPLKLYWETVTGVPLPPLALEITTGPPPRLEMNLRGRSDVGISLPLSLKFSEPVADREGAVRNLSVRTAAGVAVEGRREWADAQRLRFIPTPHWPASSTIVVAAESGGLQSGNGEIAESSKLGSFTTGPDRRIAVYLDTQSATALEEGRIVRAFKVSTGKAATPTVTGSFYIYARFPLKTMRSDAKPGEPGHYVIENVPYAQYFYKDYALHGAWWHNGFGRPASHGCVNFATRTRNRRWPHAPEDAGWLYQWASLGVPVTVYAKTPSP